MTAPKKFIQITAGDDGLYALDADGRVWGYNPGLVQDRWEVLTNKREDFPISRPRP